MTQPPKARRLGRGLAALIGDDTTEEAVVQDARSLRHVPIELIEPSPNNPRRLFREEDLEDLSRSLREKGMLQPLLVRRKGDNRYEIIAGERRWRAAQRAGLHDLPVLIRDLSDGEALEIALVENIQRADLNPIEEARGYSQLIDQFGYTQQKLAESVGKSRSHIANTLRLLTLPDEVQRKLEAGELTAGHARTLIATADPIESAEQIVKLGLTVRDAERLSRETSEQRKPKAERPEKSVDIAALENELMDHLGLRVDITDRGRKGGRITLHYGTLEQLDDLCRRLIRS
ncbi:MAG: ParB/RepB/Spo0J family partition protein [Hyphomicrobiales bacterium]